MWRDSDPQGGESAKIKYEIVPFTRGHGLDLGCGPYKTYAHFIGIDNGHHAHEFGWDMKPDVMIETCANLEMFASGTMNFVFSSHLLEHMEDLDAVLAEWFRVIKVGGHLVLYLPDDSLYPKKGEPGANPDHKHDLNRNKILAIMKKVGGWDLVVNERRDQDYGEGSPKNEYSFLQVYCKREDRKHTYPAMAPKPAKTAIVIRYGAFGDAIQSSSILPGLKEAGYHITFCTVPRGQAVLLNDPNIDEWLIQDKDQVPNEELIPYWASLRKKYDLFINLSETVEGSLLSIPGRASYSWPKKVRHNMQNVSYLEMTHAIAGVDMPPRSKFYPTDEEVEKMQAIVDGCGSGPVIMWLMRGSAVHKVSLYIDQVIAKLLTMHPDTHIITVGDGSCQILEAGWEKEPRVVPMAGRTSIRESMALAQLVDVVVGPETGVLNAVAMDDVGKVALLSHSSPENLTKHWINAVPLYPDMKEVKCYPCHCLHYDWTTCEPFTFTKAWCDKNAVSTMGGLLEPGVKVAKCSAFVFPDMIYNAITSRECFQKPKLVKKTAEA